ncbi:Ras-related protein Rab-33 [Trichinella murrelli]|uniref:Ras-related protein Rab-33 n=1 Tax=Trichinella murrelli TaxID=144512 RepID=A0A0V0U6W9_9BILA|nr:Ras-related protein Rab-33 [Trichinella murrelli]
MSVLQASDPKKDSDKTEKMLKESEKADPYQALQQIRVVAHNRRRTFKVIVLGDPGVGKTCLTFRFCNGRFPSNSTPTIGVDFREKIIDLDGETLRVQFWDTAGQERFQQSMIAHYYRNVNAVIFVYDVSQISSFRNLIRWIEECQKHNIFGTVPMILIGNKCDLESVVTTEEAQIFADKHDMPLFLTSAQDDLELNHVESIFMTLAHILQKNKSLHVTTDEERATFAFDVQKLRNDVIEKLEKYQNSYCKLLEQKLKVNKRLDSGESFRKIAENVGVDLSTVSDICRSRRQLTCVKVCSGLVCIWYVHMVAYHMNRAPKQKETSTTPYEEWFGKRPPIEHLRAFSCDVYILFPDLHRKKFVPKARKVVFVGYASNYNIFRVYKPRSIEWTK